LSWLMKVETPDSSVTWSIRSVISLR